MANEFVAKNGLISQNNTTVTGSLIVSAGITGSLFGTASWAENALTASYLSGYVSPFPYTGSAIITGSLVITGSLTATANSTINGLSVGKGNNDIATNTAFGVSALAVNIAGATAVSNTAIGRLTLAANTNGSNSTAVGNQALQLNSVGIWNTAVGSTALGSNTSGSYNTAVGVGASLLLSTGSFNTAIGSYAGRRSNGTFNTIMGYNTFQATSTGGSNTIIGGQAGYSATGNDNTLIGTQAGYNLTSGNNNVILGNNTGFGLTTGIANTILGGYVQGLATGLSNTVILADGTGSIRLYSPSTGNVLIGTTTDGGYKFDVSGSGVSGSVRFQNGLTVTGSLLTSGSSITFTPSVIATTVSQSYFLITGSIQQVQTASAQIYGINIAPIMIFTTGSQTNTVLRVAPTFSGSAALTSSQQNIVADFGAVGAGTQFIVNDITSGSIYMVNDVSGLPIIEALSDWTVNMYNYPTKVFQKTGSAVIISGSLNVSGSINVGGRQAVNGPTIRVNANTVTTQMTSSVVAIIKFDTVLWDSGSLSGSNFNMTNANASINGYTVGPYSFSPSVAGYYQVAGHFSFGSMGASTGTIITTIYKNGSEYCRGTRTPCNVSGGSGDVNTIIYFNGAGDYINIQAIQNSGNTETTEASSAFGSWFTATMLRGA